MSQFIGASLPVNIVDSNDKRLLGLDYQYEMDLHPWAMNAIGEGDFTGPWWPGASSVIDDSGASIQNALLVADSWSYHEFFGGTTSRYGVIGVTRDVNGSPLGGVTVKLYRTSTDEMVASIVSDPVGNYTITTPYYPDPHYLVMYKSGFPDVFGTTVNTILGG